MGGGGPTGLVARAVDRLGVSLGTRYRIVRGQPLGVRSHSRRDGYRPEARQHVERYLLVEVLGVKIKALCWASGLSYSTILESVRVGRELAKTNARELGLDLGDVILDREVDA